MAETSTATVPCRYCQAQIPRNPIGRTTSQCHECRVTRRRTRQAAYDRRRRAGIPTIRATTWDCERCGGTFPRPHLDGQLPKRCQPCGVQYERERSTARNAKKYAALRRRYEADGRWVACQTCGEQLACAQKGPAPRWCRPCRTARYRLQARMPLRGSTRCSLCGAATILRQKGVPRTRCDDCATAMGRERSERWKRRHPEKVSACARRMRQRRRARLAGVENERFSAESVFERDKWRCGICNRKITAGLRHPHPLSASLDHVIPISHGGPHTRANTRASHLRCNIRRNNRGGNEQLALIG